MPFAMRDVIERTAVPEGVSLSANLLHDRIEVFREDKWMGAILRRQIDDANGRIDKLLKHILNA